jgi:hypothetical protein
MTSIITNRFLLETWENKYGQEVSGSLLARLTNLFTGSAVREGSCNSTTCHTPEAEAQDIRARLQGPYEGQEESIPP